MTWLGKRLDVALVLRPAPLVPPGCRIFTPTRRSLVYELVVWLLGQGVALFLLLLFLFGPVAVETFAWTSWLWPLERALQGSAWLEQLMLSLVPHALHMLVSALSVIAFVTQLLLTLVGIWASHRYTWVVVDEENLRLHRGWLSTHDVTMRYAVVQQIRLRQGLLQRLFGIGDVELSSAAGSEDDEDRGSRTAHVRNIAQAAELRDIVRGRAEIAQRLPDPPAVGDAQVAAAELLQAAVELRTVLEKQGTCRPGQQI
jgi:membrane protein YdbS with pleckstrin-like domain